VAEPEESLIPNPMEYRGTENPVTLAHYRAVMQAATVLYDTMLGHCPQSAERTLAVGKLQEARMWANAAIAFEGKRYRM
jgi:hypothetical protein